MFLEINMSKKRNRIIRIIILMAIVFLIYEIIEIMSSEKEMIYDINNNNISTNNIIENEANITVNKVAKRMNKKDVNE